MHVLRFAPRDAAAAAAFAAMTGMIVLVQALWV